MASSSSSNPKVVLSFDWQGPHRKNGGLEYGGSNVSLVQLCFPDTKHAYGVAIPGEMLPGHKLEFYKRDQGGTIKTPRLAVSIEKLRGLAISVFIANGSTEGSGYNVSAVSQRVAPIHPTSYEAGQNYRLTVTSNQDFLVTAKVEKTEPSCEKV